MSDENSNKSLFKKDILIIDDNVDNLKTLESFFLKEGISVRCVTSGYTALMIAKNLKPGLILLDIQMPDMNGFDVCAEFKKNPNLKDIPILFLSAETNVNEKIKAFKYGAVDYITKPFQFEETLARVKTHMYIMNLREELETSNSELKVTIDELKDTQNQLVQSAKMASLGTLVAGITHEINNPVNFIMTGIPAMENMMIKLKNEIKEALDFESDTPIENFKNKTSNIDQLLSFIDEILANIKTGAIRTANIVGGLKQFTKADSSITESFNVNECIDFALLILYNEYKLDITINKNFDSLPEIRGFKVRIEQAFLNIIKNSIDAIKNTKIKGIIEINTSLTKENDKKYILITIKDSGGGIKHEIIDKIFDPFFTTKDVGSGVGLGLSITYKIIKDHGGDISVSNVDDGCSFQIILPLNQEEAYE